MFMESTLAVRARLEYVGKGHHSDGVKLRQPSEKKHGRDLPRM